MDTQNQGHVIFVGTKQIRRGFGEGQYLAESNARQVGERLAELVEDEGKFWIAEELKVAKDATNYSLELPRRRFKLVGQVTTCRGHHHTDPALVPLVNFLGEWVPGRYIRVGGRAEFQGKAVALRAAYDAWLKRERGSMGQLKYALANFFA